MSEMELNPPIYGIETEYSCLVTLPGGTFHEIVGSCHSTDIELGLYQEPLDKGTKVISEASLTSALGKMSLYRNPNGMLSNGGRIYFDPSGPEYCTPETTTAEEAVHRSFDGDEILLGAFRQLREHGIIENYQINRKIVDHNRASRGIHLNTSTQLSSGELDLNAVGGWLAALNVAKGAIFGSGGLLLDYDGTTSYHHSPRLSLTTHSSGNYSAYSRRPLIRRPLKDDVGQKRLETVTSDALNFGWPLRASLVLTNATVGIIELGYGELLPTLHDPVSAAQVVGQFGPLSKIEAIDLKNNIVEANPLDLIRTFCETILDIDAAERHLDKESSQVIPEIIDVVDKMKTDIYSVVDQVESVARLVAMQKKAQKDNLTFDSERMCRFDYAWDWIGGSGIAERLRNKNLAGWQGFKAGHSALATKKRILTPPKDTRAKVRGDKIKQAKGKDDSTWITVDYGHNTLFMHPLDTEIIPEAE